PARSGGLSLVVSGFAVQQELVANHQHAWEQLRQPFHVDRRGGVLPGEAPTVRFPVLGGDDRDLLVRYLRYWIEVGQEKAGQPLDKVGLVLGPLLMLGWLVFVDTGSLRPEAHRLAGILILTLVWWVTEPIPIPATGLLAVALCVVLRAMPEGERARAVLAPFA